MAVQYAFGKIITQGLDLNVDAADPTSYPGTGTTWTSVVNRSITGSLVSCSFSSDFKGGIVFNNPSASVQFPGTVANYGTGSFTIEMAFRPTQIQGIHYLVSKNSGSFPNWGVYLSGSGGSGKLWATYNISAAISCSVSSSTTFVTGSNYFVDAIFEPQGRRMYINVNGNYDSTSVPSNGTGTLTVVSPTFIGNIAPSSSLAYSGSIFNFKTYSTVNFGSQNFRLTAYRLQQSIPLRASSALTLLVGGGGGSYSGGGGGGGLVLTALPLTPGSYNVVVGAGGNTGGNGQTSSLANIIAYGGGAGGAYGSSYTTISGSNGASGGGGGATNAGSFVVNSGSAIYINQFNLGNNGGRGAYYAGGGGGGAGTTGTDGVINTVGGNGGQGLLVSITGIPTYYAGGGGAGGYYPTVPGVGGLGGGGSASFSTPQPGAPNTGGGAGGGLQSSGTSGGSGIVVIRYFGDPVATGGTITSVDGDTIHTFTSSGNFTVF
jgi:hypothetical protein